MVTGKNTDGLEGFAKTHVITKDAMQLVLVQESQPVDTALLEITTGKISNVEIIRQLIQITKKQPGPLMTQ